MKKTDGWEQRFHHFLVENRNRPFVWGEWDCCIFTNAAVKEITGQDLIPSELSWTDEESAIKAIEGYGRTLGMSVAKAAKAAGLTTVDSCKAQKGDVVVVKENGGQVAGICDGHAVLCPSDDGFTYRPKDQIQRVFRING